MKRKIAAITAGLALAVSGAGAASGSSDDLTLPRCESEDQLSNCYWDASEQGNGKGTDFVVIDGVVFYPEG